ncbi:MAG: hypothetical protein AB8H79_09895 [Myxococcota bacterium]
MDTSEAAEEVRRHLVSLRGGAAFMSPDDAALLSGWLDQGIPTSHIVLALERLADARRRKPRRTPFTLAAARRHMSKTTRVSAPTSRETSGGPDHPLGPFTDAFRAQHSQDPRIHELADLALRLTALPANDPTLLEVQAQALCRDFLLQAWECMDDWEREARLTTAREELEAALPNWSAADLYASAEELARDQLRQSYTLISAATLRKALTR